MLELLARPVAESALSREMPFPGLRPFGEEDAQWLFGRSREINELLKRLRRLHFLAIVGASGSGKSSVVRAGVLPQIRDGYLDAEWRIAQFRPGDRPMANLAEALGPELGTSPEELMERLRRGPRGLVRGVEMAELPVGSKVLILVDQFEELFQFAQRTGDSAQEEIKEFLKLLLTAASSDDVAVYVLVTMRLEWLNECASYAGLAEAINEGLYLVPQMRRQQFQQAILGPLEAADGGLTSALLDRMLNDLDNKSDQLPVLQHALLRLWGRIGTREPFDIAAYESVGTFSNCLSAHAEEVYAELTPRQQQVAEVLFRSITQVNKNRKMRRPRPVAEILNATRAGLAGPTFAEVEAVILAFSRPGRSFLATTQGALTPASIVDLSHEALIRQWTRLAEWVDHEAEVEARLQRLREDAVEWDRDRKGQKACLYTGSRLLRAAELQPMLPAQSTEAVFLKESVRLRSLQAFRKWAGSAAIGIFVVTIFAVYFADRNRAARAADEARVKQAQLESALATEQAKKAQDFQQNLVQRIDAAKGDKTALAAIAESIQAKRVYIQYLSGASQLIVAKTLQQRLQKQGYAVPGVEQVSSDKAPGQTQVRFFHPEDRADAQKLAGVLNAQRQLGYAAPLMPGNAVVQLTSNPRDVVPLGQFEVWIAVAPASAQDVAVQPVQQQIVVNQTQQQTQVKPEPKVEAPVATQAAQVPEAAQEHVPQQVAPQVVQAPLVQAAPQNPEPAAIRAALERYREAYQGESLDDMLKAWPTIPKNQQKNLKLAFEQFNAIRLTLNCGDDLHLQGDSASVACRQTAVYTIKGKREPEQSSTATFRLRKAGGGWVVEGVQ